MFKAYCEGGDGGLYGREVVKRLEISEGVDLGLGLLGLLVSIDLRLVGLLG